VAQLHEMVAVHAEEPSDVVVGIELDRGLLVGALVAAGYAVHAINPLSVDRYRDRHRTSGAKSDPGDAKVLADLVRTDRHLHREVAGDSELAEAVKVLARAHQGLIWSRQRQLNQLRNALREFYPAALEAFATDLASPEALAVLEVAPTPAEGRSLSTTKIAAALKRAGRRRRITERAEEIKQALATSQLEAPAVLARAYGDVVRSTVRIVAEVTAQMMRSRQSSKRVLRNTRTPRSFAVCLDSVWSSAPGSSRSSGHHMTKPTSSFPTLTARGRRLLNATERVVPPSVV
jgi:transposase